MQAVTQHFELTYLAVLLHLNLLEELTQGSTITSTVLPADTNLLRAASLQ